MSSWHSNPKLRGAVAGGIAVVLLAAASPAAATTVNVVGCVNAPGSIPLKNGSVEFDGTGGTSGVASGVTDASGCTPSMQLTGGTYNITYYAPHYIIGHDSNIGVGADGTYTKTLVRLPYATGRVTDAVTGQPLEGAQIAWCGGGIYCVGPNGEFHSYTDSNGDYETDFGDPSDGPYPGAYTACVAPASGPYMPNCYSGQASRTTATPIQVAGDSAIPNLDFAVMEAGYINGTTTPANNDGMTVTAYDSAGHAVATGAGGGSGDWSVLAPVGTEYLLFHEPPFADQYYSAKGGLACADPLSVTFGGVTTAPSAVIMGSTAPAACPSTGGGGGGPTGGGGGPTGAPGGTSGATGTPGVSGHQSIVITAGGVGHLKVSCSSVGPCSGSLRISVGVAHGVAVTARAKRVVIASARFSNLTAGKTSSVRFALNAAGKRLLRRSHRRFKATVAVSFSSGGKATTQRTVVALRRH